MYPHFHLLLPKFQVPITYKFFGEKVGHRNVNKKSGNHLKLTENLKQLLSAFKVLIFTRI